MPPLVGSGLSSTPGPTTWSRPPVMKSASEQLKDFEYSQGKDRNKRTFVKPQPHQAINAPDAWQEWMNDSRTHYEINLDYEIPASRISDSTN